MALDVVRLATDLKAKMSGVSSSGLDLNNPTVLAAFQLVLFNAQALAIENEILTNLYTGSGAGSIVVASAGQGAAANGAYDIAIGQNASVIADYNFSVGLGYGATPGASNQIRLGTSTETVHGGAYTDISDMRDKTNIQDNDLGLEALKKIHTVKYQGNYRESYYLRDDKGKLILSDEGEIQYDKNAHENKTKKGSRWHRGVIAQEILSTFDSMELSAVKDFQIKDSKAFPQMSVDYNQFIPITIKAVQELSDKHDALQFDYDSLQAKYDSLEAEYAMVSSDLTSLRNIVNGLVASGVPK